MGGEINIKAHALENGIPTTRLMIIVDLNSIIKLLVKYDLLLQTTLEVKENITETVKRYEYAEIYRGIKENTISFEAIILGTITSSQNIEGKVEGILINRERGEEGR